MEKYKIEVLPVPGGEINLYIISPKETSGGDTLMKILIIPGWCEPAKVSIGLAEELAKFGYQVFVIDYANLNTPVATKECGVDSTFPITEQARACAVVEFLKVKNAESRTYIVAHSQGAVAAMLAAKAHPNRIKNIILVAPAGIITSNLVSIILQYLKSFFAQLKYVLNLDIYLGKRYFEEVWQYAWRNPIQLARDAYGVSKSNIVPLVKKSRDQGLDVAIIYTNSDRIFPPEKMYQYAGSLCPTHELRGNHDELFFNPKEFAQKINELFS